jgi:uncharacterized protein (DUF433 family)
MSLAAAAEPVPLVTDADGVVRMAGTRVTLDTVVSAFRSGATAEEVAQDFPTLQLADIYAVLTYYLRHRGEVDAYLDKRRDFAQRIRQENEARSGQREIRERLLARARR